MIGVWLNDYLNYYLFFVLCGFDINLIEIIGLVLKINFRGCVECIWFIMKIILFIIMFIVGIFFFGSVYDMYVR